MTEYGITSTGFRRKTFDEIYEEMSTFVRSRVSSALLLTPAEPEGAILIGATDQLSKSWENLELAYHGIDRRAAIGDAVVSLGKLSGTWRKPAQRGQVTETFVVQLVTGTTIDPGDVLICEEGNPTNSWYNRDPIVIASHEISGGEIVPQSLSGIFVSSLVSALAVGPAHSLTYPLTVPDGVSDFDNAADAEPGIDEESVEDLRLRGELMLGRRATTTINGIQAAVNAVEGVQFAVVENNAKDQWSKGIPPHSFRVTIWDGISPEALDTEVAEAIFERLPPGTSMAGEYSTAITADSGEVVNVKFDRCPRLLAYVAVTVYGNVGADVIESAILANAQPQPSKPLYWASIVEACLAAGATHCDVPQIGLTASPTGYADIVPSNREIVLLASDRISVTVVTP